MTSKQPTLSIIIPAYNEEDAIASIIERTLAARSAICEKAGIDSVEVIVVNDGSADRTAEIARGYKEIKLISYENNRGYGAAIKQGFEQASGDLLSFLDADGTCDPLFFIELCNALEKQNADVVLGSRLGPNSEMPAIRRLGNRIFASIINFWGGTHITDSASGMRVIRRGSLPSLYPLPDGLHFTPAMSCRAIFDPQLKIVEVPMPYSERTGESKLRVIKDGLRFLRIIVDTALTYRPLRFFGSAGFLVLLLGIAYGLHPILFYLDNRSIEEDMIYRLVAVVVAMAVGFNLLGIGVLAQQTVSLMHEDFSKPHGVRAWLYYLLLRRFIPLGILSLLLGIGINAPSLWEYATQGRISAHWVYILTGGMLVVVGIEFICFGVMARVLDILTARKQLAKRSPA